MRFRKKPILIEAIQYDRSEESYFTLREFTDGRFALIDEVDREDDPSIEAEIFGTLDSTWVGITKGTWVIRSVSGELYSCPSDIFCELYEPCRTVEEAIA